MRYQLHCQVCGRDYDPQQVRYACPQDGPLAVLEAQIDYASVEWRPEGETMWRYRALLPSEAAEPAIAPGVSPLLPVERLRTELGLARLWVKDETRNPTGSLKDRASSLCIAKAHELAAQTVSCASTGNAAASWAAAAAAEGLACKIFVPSSAPKAKLAQVLAYGATVFAVDGAYDDAFDLCIAASERFGWYNRNTGYNPYTIEGKKTVSFEIAEQLDWHSPDAVVVPVGDGCIISGVAKGFRDLLGVGAIDRLPRLIAAQSEGSDAIKRALDGDGQVRPVEAHTIADSISVGMPRVGALAVRAVCDSHGEAIAVTDADILEAQRRLGRLTGVFAEPAACAPLAAVEKANLAPDETVVLLVTGSGLKQVEAVRGEPVPVHDLKDVENALT